MARERLRSDTKVYDTKLFKLQLGASAVVDLGLATRYKDFTAIRHLRFFTDNDSTVGRVTERPERVDKQRNKARSHPQPQVRPHAASPTAAARSTKTYRKK